ncbi:MAG TPA: NAD(P)-dependent oxidoreductase [Aquabacterium sp.]|uniref:NAD(P)-dependent oxidoreductase n=1 Tax=Aquabacterium sp. TaxID=1872578 RepID=UPI002E36D8EE|nr:NAD(P)-dependent oxidoreductase [Aquabacterium sp.]HEX5355600.1 NAD(P)-dependent oxidoreductase [Aquabacterium sp.]
MNIALIGATGFVGSAILSELLQRGHQVTALARHPDKVPAQAGLTVVQADVQQASQVAQAVKGHDAVISAFNAGWANPNLYDDFLAGSRAITAGVKAADVERLLVVGGAGSLFVAPGVQLVDTPAFPAEWKVGATAARDALKLLQAEQDLAWTFLSPPALLHPGERTGHFRVGGDELLMNAQGDAPAEITSADLAVAIVNEIEAPQHVRRRFTVGY